MEDNGTVKIEGLRKEFGDVLAVDGIDLEIGGGEFFTILGPSGCGKTTTLRCIAGLETPTAGDVYISGDRVTHLPANKRRTSIVFQRWALFPHMDVASNIGFGLEMAGVPKDEREERIEDVLDLVELPGYGDRKPTELSGGQKQRVAMARSIVQEPDVLLLDEPLASLDRALRERLQIELKNIQDELDITFIHVTHDQEEALTMSDRIAVMNEGHLEQVGTVTELYEKPESRFVAEFVGETNLIEGSLTRSNGMLEIASDVNVQLSADVHDNPAGDSDSAVLTIRPESLRLVARNDLDSDNWWNGTVSNVVYKGSSTLYEVDIGERIVRIEKQRQKGERSFEEGAAVTVGFDADEGKLIRGAEGES
ncbi:ABC transporter ATP-binding protein [Natronomonas sp.]|uniref:ABC transporter ATP-binding protein n=1 Tax=Natronomonas sp. TaxID=2184060 RepID=UPI00397621A3